MCTAGRRGSLTITGSGSSFLPLFLLLPHLLLFLLLLLLLLLFILLLLLLLLPLRLLLFLLFLLLLSFFFSDLRLTYLREHFSRFSSPGFLSTAFFICSFLPSPPSLRHICTFFPSFSFSRLIKLHIARPLKKDKPFANITRQFVPQFPRNISEKGATKRERSVKGLTDG